MRRKPALISVAILLGALPLYAADYEIESIHSTEGVGLTCITPSLTLGIYGETGRFEIMAERQNDEIRLTSTDISYNQPLAADTGEPLETVLERTVQTRFRNGNMLTDPRVTADEQAEALENYQLLKEALTEVQQNGGCPDWKL